LASHKRKEVAARMARIRGSVRGVEEMVAEERPYPDVVHQLHAIRSALDGVIQVIVDDLVEDCVAREGRKEAITDSLSELQKVVAEIR
jgi:CsoR family transcriptional regulator, copper-sensing transcriptional repressor